MPQYQIPTPHPLIQGPTTQQTFPIPPVSQPLSTSFPYDLNRYLGNGPRPQFEGATSQQTYIFPLSEPTRIPLVLQPEVVKRFEGATNQQTFPLAWITQPEFSWYRTSTNRYLWEGPEQQFDGPTTQQTFIFPLAQPIRPVTPQQPFVIQLFNGAAALAAQTYLFPVSQPGSYAWALLNQNRWIIDVVKQYDGPGPVVITGSGSLLLLWVGI